MKKYRVFLHGKNFLIRFDGRKQVVGFYTTRFVEAENPEEAENKAVQLIREDRKLQKVVLNDKSDPPMIFVEEIEEKVSFDGVKLPGTGYTFYPVKKQKRK